MAEQDEQGLVIVGSDGTEHEFPAGMDPQKAAAVVREQEAFAKSGPMERSRTGQMYRHPSDPVSKDFIGGATEVLNPMNYVRAAKAAWDHPVDTALDSAVNLVKAPFRIAGGLITEPARTLGGMTAGMAAGEVLPLAPKPIARSLGKALETAGTKAEWPMQVAASAKLLSGNAGGLAVMAVPPVLRKAGRALQSFGTTAAELKAEADTMLQRGNPAVKPSIRINAPSNDLYKVAQENAADAKAAKGMAATAEDTNPMIGGRRLNDYPPEVQAKFRQSMTGTNGPVTAAPPRPSIRIVGKAAADLAAEPTPVEKFLQSDPQARIGGEGRMTGQFKEGPGGLSDLQAGKITPAPMGKAASDVAEGKVPTASSAPTPSDTRMDELVGKFAEGPKPARVSPQDAIPASKSKGAMSATPGLTRADVESIGLNPDNPIKAVTPEMVEKIKANRASRHQTNYANAQSDRRYGTTRDELKSILEQSLLMNMDRLR